MKVSSIFASVEFIFASVEFTFANVEFTFASVEFIFASVEFTFASVEFTFAIHVCLRILIVQNLPSCIALRYLTFASREFAYYDLYYFFVVYRSAKLV